MPCRVSCVEIPDISQGKGVALSREETLLSRITADERYLANLDWGRPRRGHPEGTVRAHIEELEQNLSRLRPRLLQDEIAKLQVLIHVHDSFKADAEPGVPISHPRSHASLARSILAEFTDDAVLLNIVQYHDEPFALWQQFRHRGYCSDERLMRLVSQIGDWHLFGAFLLIDGCTPGKGSETLEWFLPLIGHHAALPWTAEDARWLCQSQRR
jgi:hypothetical protein